MTINSGASWLFNPQPQNRPTPAPRPGDEADTSQRARRTEKSRRHLPTASKRAWREPKPARDLHQELLSRTTGKRMCCSGLRCVEALAAGGGQSDRLILEQGRMSEFKTETGRKEFVSERAPLLKPGKGSMLAGGKLVCNQAFMGLFGVTSDLINSVKRTAGARAQSTTSRTTMSAKPSSPKRAAIVAFLTEFGETQGQKMPHNERIYLYGASHKEVYERYVTALRRQHGPELAADITAAPDYFNAVWREELPTLKMKAGGDFMMCTTCVGLKEFLHGASGQRATQDPIKAAQVKADYEAHIKDVEADRKVIALLEQRARTAKADGRPQDFVYCSADAADQSKLALPHEATLTHGGDKGYAEKQKVYGILVEGHSMNIFFTPQILGTGSNLVATTLFLQLADLVTEFGQPIAHLVLQVDNTVAEAKNNYLVSFLGMLVARRVVKTVEMMFMPVGHTHIKIDQTFGRFALAVKGRNIFARSQLADVLRSAYTALPVRCRTLDNLANFKGTTAGNVNRMHMISWYRGFRVSQLGPAIVVEVKKNMHDENWLGFSANGKEVGGGEGFAPHRLFYAGTLRLEGTPAYELKVVEPKTRELIRQRYVASRDRMAAAFPGDLARQKELIREQDAQMKLLESTGTRPFDLDLDWLPEAASGSLESSNIDEETSDEDGDDDNLLDHESSDEEDARDRSAHTKHGAPLPRRLHASEKGAVGSFAFFLASGAPFLVGKVDEERENAGGDREVRLLWYTPKEALVKIAASVEFDAYAKAVFRQTYVVEGDADGPKKNRKVVPDSGWELASRVVASCEDLRKKKYIPGKVLKELRQAKDKS